MKNSLSDKIAEIFSHKPHFSNVRDFAAATNLPFMSKAQKLPKMISLSKYLELDFYSEIVFIEC